MAFQSEKSSDLFEVQGLSPWSLLTPAAPHSLGAGRCLTDRCAGGQCLFCAGQEGFFCWHRDLRRAGVPWLGELRGALFVLVVPVGPPSGEQALERLASLLTAPRWRRTVCPQRAGWPPPGRKERVGGAGRGGALPRPLQSWACDRPWLS